MTASKNELAIQSILINTGLVQPIKCKSKGKLLEVLCRQLPGQERAWLAVVRDLLELASEKDFELHICRRYVLKNKKLAFGWNIGIESKTLKLLPEVIDSISVNLEESKPDLDGYQTHAPQKQKVPSPPVQATPQSAQQHHRPLPPGKHPPPRVTTRKSAEGEPTRILKHNEKFNVAQDTIGADGKRTTVLEMPLPHVTQDLNKPDHEGGRGAKYTSGS